MRIMEIQPKENIAQYMFYVLDINILARRLYALGHSIEYKDAQKTYPGQ